MMRKGRGGGEGAAGGRGGAAAGRGGEAGGPRRVEAGWGGAAAAGRKGVVASGAGAGATDGEEAAACREGAGAADGEGAAAGGWRGGRSARASAVIKMGMEAALSAAMVSIAAAEDRQNQGWGETSASLEDQRLRKEAAKKRRTAVMRTWWCFAC